MTHRSTPAETLPEAAIGGEQEGTDIDGIEVEDTDVFIDSALLGIALVDVRGLNPIWPGKAQHRDIQKSHIDKLIASFRIKGIDRCGVNTHLKASISREHFDAMVTKFVENKTGRTATAIAAVEQMKHMVTHDLEQMVRLDLPTSIGPTSPTLEAGQHRRHALIQLNETPDVPLADDHDVYRPSDDGDSFRAIALGLEAKTAGERSELLTSEATLTDWVTRTFGTNIDNSGRWATVLRNDALRPVFANYVSSSYGRKNFSITTADRIAGSKNDQFWIPKFEQHFDFLNSSFGNSLSKVAASDIEQLMSFGFPIYDDDLRPLFFPDVDDFAAGILKGKLRVNEKKYFRSGPDGHCLPRMNPAYNWQGKLYTNRRPRFLARLPDDEYQAVFPRIREVSRGRDIADIRMWPSIINTVNRIQPLRKLLSHIMFWVMPDWTVPANSALEYRSFQWPVTISTILSDGDGDGDAYDRAVRLIDCLFKHISDSNNAFSLPVFKDHFKSPTGRITQPDCPTDSDEASAYQSRFKHPHWHQLIPICREHRMLPFAGCMAVFNDDEMLMKLTTLEGVQITDSQLTINYELNKYPPLATLRVKERRRRNGTIIRALLHYQELKQVLINTLCYGFSAQFTVRPKDYEELTLDSQTQLNEAWDDIVRYGEILSNAGCEAWPENMAEDLEQYGQRRKERRLGVEPLVLDKTLLNPLEIQKDPDLLNNLKRYAETPEEVPKSGLHKRVVVVKKEKGDSAGEGGGAAKKKRKKRAGAEL
ncbi:hypothetical protein FQN50_006418 [Emmonsiellopsis sp. PD_5]|nr:hypothetical protein FQN50_006418 [Emmonsiellopsis sp. PD_5]